MPLQRIAVLAAVRVRARMAQPLRPYVQRPPAQQRARVITPAVSPDQQVSWGQYLINLWEFD